MCAMRVLTKCSFHAKSCKPYLTLNFIAHQHHGQYQTRRNLILETSASEFVKLHRLTGPDSGIVQISLDRPKVRNAIGKEMLQGLSHAFELINQKSYANVAIISSSVPGVFCAGADLKERREMSQSEAKTFVNSIRSTFSFLEAVCVPTIAVIEGVALGGGLELALACDIRICGENSLMGLPETGLAIIPAAGGSQRLPRLVGKAIAKDIIFTGRKVDGKEALSLGLVNYCAPAGEAYSKALAVARDINQKGPVAIRMAKKAINEGVETDLTSALVLEEDYYDYVLSTKDRLEGLAAFAEKRKPRYTGE
ncbi:probable enoyl-CoA hydratase 2, mitochondrial [Vigna unguiculata]|uniref:Methylglutaconyl-CoA hydratase n=1 Tax=Vigna unguiculata TaxID=3917 RepID=A0A4D6KZF6_VIGUN|nr:probable enoyl-CoA hydratase 2, mitochondrial [Vigna unguiculata]QCD81339.1 methylglutaconyl-CoA hydratase [Vigna unguiculata]